MHKPPSSAGASTQPPGRFQLLVVSILAAIVGAAAGVAAWLLYGLITLVSNLVFYGQWSFIHRDDTFHILGLWVAIVPALGGIVVGLMAKYGSDKIRGHGIPEAMEAVLFNRSRIQPRVAILKPLSAAISIGTGGPFGAEGPIIQTGGALGSIVGQTIRLTAAERKVLLASGAAAGMAATFSTPIAAVIIAIELLLFEYRPRSFVPLVIASTLATAVRFALIGPGAMFTVGASNFGVPHALPWYIPLGVVCGLAATVFSNALYWVEDQFEKLSLDQMWWPAIGGIGVGVIAIFVPRVLGVGYETISDLLNNRLALDLVILLLFAKGVALLVSLGSGTSGGLLAPMFTVGAAIGSVYAGVINHWIPWAHLSPSAFALVAMAAFFGSAARAPFAFIVFAFELTRNYDSILPLMLVVVVAHGVALMFMKNSIMTEKLARRGLRVHQEYEVDVFEQFSVSQVMDKSPSIVPASTPVAEIAERIAAGDPAVTRHQALLLADANGGLAGIMTRGDIVRALERDPKGTLTALDAGVSDPYVAYPDEALSEALTRMLENECGRLPVVARDNPKKIVGYLGRAAILQARLSRQREDRLREPGWIESVVQRGPKGQ